MNLEQLRAAHAFAEVAHLPAGVERAEFLAVARDLPATFQRNGLLAAWAFLLAKSAASKDRAKSPHGNAARACQRFFRELGLTAADNAEASFRREWLGEGDGTGVSAASLMRLTAEAIAYAGWLKRAAETLCAGVARAAENGEPPAEGGQ